MSKLMVRSLPYSTSTEGLRDIFAPFGQVTECKVIMDRDTGRSKGYGFVSYATAESAGMALAQLDNFVVDGRGIRVQYADNGGGHRREERGTDGGGFARQDSRGIDGGGFTRQDSRGEATRHDSRGEFARHDSRQDSRGEFSRQESGMSRDGREKWDDRRDDRDRWGGDRRDARDHRGQRDRSPGRGREHYGKQNVHGGGAEQAIDPMSDNARIYITGIPEGTSEEDLAKYFGQIGIVARKKQKRGFPDQWPFKISIYRDESGKPKGDATLTYVDPNAAQSAPGFFNDTEFKGCKITVQIASQAEEKERPGDKREVPSQPQSSRDGGRDRYQR